MSRASQPDIGQNIQQVRQRIATACHNSHRDPAAVNLLAVSKTKPISAIQLAVDAGQQHFGENYLQEAAAKITQLPHQTWHYIGAIQSNKTRDIARYFDWVHTVGTEKVARRLNDQRDPNKVPLNILIQVNLNDEPSKSGINKAALPALVESIAGYPRLALRGLMAIPEQSNDPARQQENFAELANLKEKLECQFELEDFDQLSMGMSADLELAIAEGSTWVRVGTAIFGERNSNTIINKSNNQSNTNKPDC